MVVIPAIVLAIKLVLQQQRLLQIPEAFHLFGNFSMVLLAAVIHLAMEQGRVQGAEDRVVEGADLRVVQLLGIPVRPTEQTGQLSYSVQVSALNDQYHYFSSRRYGNPASSIH